MSDCTPLAPVKPVRRGLAGLWVAATAAVYLAVLWYIDRDRNILAQLAAQANMLMLCSALVLASYVFRYQRWHAVLAAQGVSPHSWGQGARAYLAGFAFTASPGKVGELLRIRYFGWQSVPASATLASFIFGRTLNLLVITALAIGAAHLVPAFGALAAIILCMLLALALLCCWPPLAYTAHRVIEHLLVPLVRQLGHLLVSGASSISPLLRAPAAARQPAGRCRVVVDSRRLRFAVSGPRHCPAITDGTGHPPTRHAYRCTFDCTWWRGHHRSSDRCHAQCQRCRGKYRVGRSHRHPHGQPVAGGGDWTACNGASGSESQAMTS